MDCPVGFICINNIHFMYLSIILIAIMYLYSNNYLKNVHQKQLLNQTNKIKKRRKQNTTTKQPVQKEIIKQIIVPQLVQESELNNIDERIQPPLKREPNRMPINIKTRGDGGPYQQIGTLFKKTNVDDTFGAPGNNDESTILSLYGKPTYIGSRHYNYYTISKEGVKIPLTYKNTNCTDDRGCEEIYDGEELTIPEYNGTFKTTIYKNESPRYIPYI